MKLIVGLGNPEKKYQNTRHNLGSKIISGFVRAYCNTPLQLKKSLAAEIFECRGGSLCPPNQKIIFAIPTEYMNNSGISVQKLAQFFKIDSNNIYIIHDDLDLKVGDYKIQFDRGPAGHNGIKSIIEKLGTQQFNRIRIGIGKPKSSVASSVGDPVEDYVLQPFSKEENDTIKNLTPKIFNKLRSIIDDQ